MYIINEEIVVLKYSKDSNIGDKAHDQPQPSRSPLALLYLYAREIINDDRATEYKYIFGNERHIKVATRNKQQQYSSLLIFQAEKPKCHHHEEYKEL